MSDQYFTAQEIASKLSLSPRNGWRTINRLADAGKIGFMKFGRIKRYKLEDIEAFCYKNGSGGQLNKRFMKYRRGGKS